LDVASYSLILRELSKPSMIGISQSIRTNLTRLPKQDCFLKISRASKPLEALMI